MSIANAIHEPEITAGSEILSCENVTKEFAGVRAVDEVSFRIEAGEWVSIVGPNGAGKTTLLNLINGFYTPTAGSVSFQDENITDLKPYRLARQGMGRTFQGLELDPDATVMDNILAIQSVKNHPNFLAALFYYGLGVRSEVENIERVEEIIDYLELWEYRNVLIKSTPVGVRRRVDLARSLVLNPSLILLDELTSGLTFEETYDMIRFIADLCEKHGLSIVMIEHDLEVVSALSDRLIVLNEGAILAEGPPEEVMENPEVVEVYTGVDVDE